MNQDKNSAPEGIKDFTVVLSSSGRYNYLKSSIKNLSDVPVVSRKELQAITEGDIFLQAAAYVAFQRGIWRHPDGEDDVCSLL
ncbi:MAG TPA: hypothetical protein O0X25_04260 [Methanocorpusculum sp.]|nr:hypothetical protein [Methanocorpusculum sp.]HJJ57351.1 hypothetical protein [Methanocorpusculum sp.]